MNAIPLQFTPHLRYVGVTEPEECVQGTGEIPHTNRYIRSATG